MNACKECIFTDSLFSRPLRSADRRKRQKLNNKDKLNEVTESFETFIAQPTPLLPRKEGEGLADNRVVDGDFVVPNPAIKMINLDPHW